MPRGVRTEKVYTGKAAKVHERILKLEADLKAAKEELKVAYKEQLKEERLAKQKLDKENKAKILKLIGSSGKTPEEIIKFLESDKS